MQEYGVSYSNGMTMESFILGMVFVSLIVSVVIVVAWWKLYQKAGKHGWACIVPIYNSYVLFDIALGSGILFLLLIVPVVNFFVTIYLYYKLARAFGKGIGYALGLIFLTPIFICMLGFGSAEYIGPQ